MNTWFNNARAILRRRQEKLDSTDDEQSEKSNKRNFSRLDHRLFNDIYCRSIGIQCNISTVDQGTVTSMITDEEIGNDRRIKTLTPSIKTLPKTNSEEFLFDEKTKPIIVTSTCLNDEQMVNDFN